MKSCVVVVVMVAVVLLAGCAVAVRTGGATLDVGPVPADSKLDIGCKDNK